MRWLVYMILCSDHSIYTGITTDMERRFAQHRSGNGAKYFRGRVPQRLLYLEDGHDRASASRREVQIKKLSALAKRQLCAAPDNLCNTQPELFAHLRRPTPEIVTGST